MTIERGLRLAAGLVVLLSVALGYFINPAWLLLERIFIQIDLGYHGTCIQNVKNEQCNHTGIQNIRAPPHSL